MLSRRTFLRSAIAILGIGAALALSPSTAFAANEGDHWIYTPNCTADQEIQLTFVNGAWHDEQELNPTRVGGSCNFVLYDNGSPISTTAGAGSGWWPDGPGHNICAVVYDWNVDKSYGGICN